MASKGCVETLTGFFSDKLSSKNLAPAMSLESSCHSLIPMENLVVNVDNTHAVRRKLGLLANCLFRTTRPAAINHRILSVHQGSALLAACGQFRWCGFHLQLCRPLFCQGFPPLALLRHLLGHLRLHRLLHQLGCRGLHWRCHWHLKSIHRLMPSMQ